MKIRIRICKISEFISNRLLEQGSYFTSEIDYDRLKDALLLAKDYIQLEENSLDIDEIAKLLLRSSAITIDCRVNVVLSRIESMDVAILNPFFTPFSVQFPENCLVVNSLYPQIVDNRYTRALCDLYNSSDSYEFASTLAYMWRCNKHDRRPVAPFGYFRPTPLTHISSRYSGLALRASRRPLDFLFSSSKNIRWTVVLGASASLNWYSCDTVTFSSLLSNKLDNHIIQIGLAGSTITDNIDQAWRMINSNLNITSIIWYGGFNDFAYGLRAPMNITKLNSEISSHCSQELLFDMAGRFQHDDFSKSPPKVPNTPPECIVSALSNSLNMLENICKHKEVKLYKILQPSLLDVSTDTNYSRLYRAISPQYINDFHMYIYECYRIAREAEDMFDLSVSLKTSEMFRDVVHLSTKGDIEVSQHIYDLVTMPKGSKLE
jgi:hypothetical protein